MSSLTEVACLETVTCIGSDFNGRCYRRLDALMALLGDVAPVDVRD